MSGMILLLCKRMFCCFIGWFFRPKYEGTIMFTVLELFWLPFWKTLLFLSFLVVYSNFLVVYLYGKQWGYLEKRYKIQQTSLINFISYFPVWHEATGLTWKYIFILAILPQLVPFMKLIGKFSYKYIVPTAFLNISYKIE